MCIYIYIKLSFWIFHTSCLYLQWLTVETWSIPTYWSSQSIQHASSFCLLLLHKKQQTHRDPTPQRSRPTVKSHAYFWVNLGNYTLVSQITAKVKCFSKENCILCTTRVHKVQVVLSEFRHILTAYIRQMLNSRTLIRVRPSTLT